MRPYEGKITQVMKQVVDKDNIAAGDGYPVQSFRELVEISAALAYLNKDSLLFYRGQKADRKSKSGKSTFYPSIYRGNYTSKQEVEHKFNILTAASNKLVELVDGTRKDGIKELKRKKYIQWSILQHYEVCDTPLLDLTQSLRVACSFAQHNNDTEDAYIYVFGMPYITNRISINSEHDLVNIRLLSICPPEALRPYFQEGFLASTSDVETEYDSKTELDFNRRLIAKFKIPNNKKFWGSEFNSIPENALYPENDIFKNICDKIKIDVNKEFKPGLVGDFILNWNELESSILHNTSLEKLNINFNTALKNLNKNNNIDSITYHNLQKLKTFRNELVHKPKDFDNKELQAYFDLLEKVKSSFGKL